MAKRGAKTGPGTAEGATPPAGGESPALSLLATDPLLLAAGAPARAHPDGSPNIDYYRWAYKAINDLSVKVALGIMPMPDKYNLAQAKDLIESEVKNLWRIDPKHLADVRTPTEKLADAMRALLDSPESAWERLDNEIEAMEKQMDVADGHAREILGGVGTDEALERRTLAKKKWKQRFSRISRLRQRAKNPVPPGTHAIDYKPVAAVHTLRFMAYVGRSSIGADSSIFQFGRHHVKMAIAIYMARNKIQYHEYQWHSTDIQGVMLVCPPGHGKSALVSHDWVLEFDKNPRLKGLIGHAQAGEAEKNLAYIGSYFVPDTANGRRNISLFNPPPLRTLKQDTMDFEDRAGERKRQPTLKAHGITAKVSGSDADFIWFDDPCDQELAEQETTRNRVYDRMNGTWRTRKRGKKTFEIITTTLWHHDDPNSRYLQLIKDNKIKFLASVQKCGGPDDQFKPLWADQYPTSKLRGIYAEMRNPRLYAAAYQSNPQPAELRKIKRLAYYLPGTPQHARFLESAVLHVSLDPTATNREKSDKASFVYAGINDIVTQNADGSQSYERRLRILDGRNFHANQTEGVNEVCEFAANHNTHYIHVEVRSGFNATAEMFEARGMDVIMHDPKNRKKELRLGDVAPMLDDTLKERGFPGAAVEFPGKLLPDGTVGPDPESPLSWLEQQVLDFGVTAEDHGVDALTQLCKHLGPELGVGEGAATVQAQIVERRGDPRLERMYRLFGEKRSMTAAEEEERWMAGQGDEW
jgi:hypothetical protein